MRETLAIEVTAVAVRALCLAGVGPARRIRSYRERPLPPGLLVPSTSLPNIREETAFAEALAQAIGPRPPRRARLVLPDASARLHVLRTDASPPAGADLRQFLLWRLQDALTFEPREARVASMAACSGAPPHRHVAIALVARDQVLAQYERLLATLGVRVAHAAPAAYHVFHLAGQGSGLAGGPIEAILALGPDSAAVILARGGLPEYARLFRRSGGVPELLGELRRTLEHAGETAGLERPARLLLGGDLGRDAGLAAALQNGLEIPCAVLPLPGRRLRGLRGLPREAQIVLSAALARI